jgi:hypothetical protein
MLKLEEIRKSAGMAFLVISNENGMRVEVPVELPIADRISKYLAKITADPFAHPGARNNTQDAE